MLPVLAAASFWGDHTVLAADFPGETAEREKQFQTLTDIARVSRSDHVVVVLSWKHTRVRLRSRLRLRLRLRLGFKTHYVRQNCQ